MAEHPNLESCPARKTADTFLDDAEKRERQRERESYPLPLSLSLSLSLLRSSPMAFGSYLYRWKEDGFNH